jgi:enoyl-CoA hydratase/carnithine racemase
MCDLRIASTEAKFGVVETRFAAGVATAIMPWIIGPNARRLIYTGDIIGADEAYRIGLLDKVCAPDLVEEEAMRIAGRMGQVAVEALQWNKRVLNQTYEIMGLTSALQYGLEACTILDSTETEEGRAFNDLRRSQGLQEALKWRRELFAPYE